MSDLTKILADHKALLAQIAAVKAERDAANYLVSDAVFGADLVNRDLFELRTGVKRLTAERDALAAALDKVLNEFSALSPETYINVIPSAVLASRDARIRAELYADTRRHFRGRVTDLQFEVWLNRMAIEEGQAKGAK